MHIILCARVSRGKQAEKELSIPAPLRILKPYAADRGWTVAATYHDIASGRWLESPAWACYLLGSLNPLLVEPSRGYAAAFLSPNALLSTRSAL
jgi:hypothetical protein